MSHFTGRNGFTHNTRSPFPTDRTRFFSESRVTQASGWRSTSTKAANSWDTVWVHSGSRQPAPTLVWRSSQVSTTTSYRSLHTWPTLQPSFPGPTLPRIDTLHRRAAPTTSGWAQPNLSFSRPRASRREALLASPGWGGGAWLTPSGDASRIRNTRGAPQGVNVVSFQNGNGPFGHSTRRR